MTRLKESLLWAGALGGVLCLVLGGLSLAFGVKPVIFRSGSMSPAIGTGALAFTHPVDAAGLHVGDVVTVRNDKGVRVTHRIRSITPNGDRATLVLKGDANRVVDGEAYEVGPGAGSADRVLFSVPKAGYVVSALSGRLGTFAGGVLVGLVLLTAFGRGERDPRNGPAEPVLEPEPAPETERLVSPRGRRLVITAGAVLALATLLAGTRGTMAYFTDTAAVDSGTFTMKASPPAAPVITQCVVGSGNSVNTISWSYGANPTTFEVRYTGNAHPAQSIAGNLRTVMLTQGLNNESGSFYLVAIVGGTASNPSNLVTYSGNGNNRTCAVQ
ncbi:MAG: signal peptidase I [Nocardioidaceae bacterium]|nr:signal peptidase I [Nocardioidaceae bacterium]